MSRTLVRLQLQLVLGVAALVSLFAPPAISAQNGADIRVLIDVSGSMRQNDPNNLRRPALRMLVGLMQADTEAGVWTFGRWVNMLVPLGEVDAGWKREAMRLSNEIASPGQFTNIEEALDRATRSWQGSPVTRQRHLLLLTDGMVDISKSAAENAASRQRILDSLLPRIKAEQAHIHAIALSERADHELLKRLAAETDGWYEQIDDADRLKRIFLRIFEKVGRPDSVPLKDNRFQVDQRVQEATILVFRNPGSPATHLTRPDGKRFDHRQLPANVSWHEDEGYELITLKEPQAGSWTLEADLDPDNRVMVLTDLQLDVSTIPNQLVVGETIKVSASLNSQGKLVKRQAFLDLVDMRAEAISAIGLDPLPLNDMGRRGDEQAGDGRYGMEFSERRPQAMMELVLAAESSTFLREKRHSLMVVAPAVMRLAGEKAVRLSLAPGALRPETVQLQLWQQAADGSRQPLMPLPEPDGSWSASLSDVTLPVSGVVEGISKNGNPIKFALPVLSLPGGAAPVSQPPTVKQPEPQTPPAVVKPPAPPKAVAAPAAATEPPPEAQNDWLMPVLILGGSNLLLVGGGLAFWLLRRRRAKAEVLALEEEALPEEAAEVPATEETD